MTDAMTICPSCRRAGQPVKGGSRTELRAGADRFLPRAPRPKASPSAGSPSREPTAPLVSEAAQSLLAEVGPGVSAQRLAELRQVAVDWVSAAGDVDELAEGSAAARPALAPGAARAGAGAVVRRGAGLASGVSPSERAELVAKREAHERGRGRARARPVGAARQAARGRG